MCHMAFYMASNIPASDQLVIANHGMTNQTMDANSLQADLPVVSAAPDLSLPAAASHTVTESQMLKIRSYQCKMCKQTFSSKSDSLAHNRSMHGENSVKPYRCPQCHKGFASSSYLSQHKRIHDGIRPYSCDVCTRSFTQLCHLQQHKRTHTGERPYRCRYTGCEKAFSQLSNLQSHSRQHQTDKPFHCNSCSKCFASDEELKGHIPAHALTKLTKTNICADCGKAYAHKSHLDKHEVKQKHGRHNPTHPVASYHGLLPANNNNNNQETDPLSPSGNGPPAIMAALQLPPQQQSQQGQHFQHAHAADALVKAEPLPRLDEHSLPELTRAGIRESTVDNKSSAGLMAPTPDAVAGGSTSLHIAATAGQAFDEPSNLQSQEEQQHLLNSMRLHDQLAPSVSSTLFGNHISPALVTATVTANMDQKPFPSNLMTRYENVPTSPSSHTLPPTYGITMSDAGTTAAIGGSSATCDSITAGTSSYQSEAFAKAAFDAKYQPNRDMNFANSIFSLGLDGKSPPNKELVCSVPSVPAVAPGVGVYSLLSASGNMVPPNISGLPWADYMGHFQHPLLPYPLSAAAAAATLQQQFFPSGLDRQSVTSTSVDTLPMGAGNVLGGMNLSGQSEGQTGMGE